MYKSLKITITLLLLCIIFTSCGPSDTLRYKYLRGQFPNCDISQDYSGSYFIIDTLSNHGALYEISFYVGSDDRIRNIRRLR